MEMKRRPLSGRLGGVEFDGELPARGDVGAVFDELDYQMACQAYLWALPLVSYAQWQQQHRDVFGATNYDLVHYVTYRDRLGLITANATTPYILELHRPGRDRTAGHRAAGRADGRRGVGLLAARVRRRWARWAPTRAAAAST